MKTSIETFWSQLSYTPTIQNFDYLKNDQNHLIVCGMGGSHLAADILQYANPMLSLFVHHDYGLPQLPASILEESLYVISSYSGNTEEALSSLQQALAKKYPVLVITTGGELAKQARDLSLPCIIMPSTGIQPRAALGTQIKALLTVIGDEQLISEANSLANKDTYEEEKQGKLIADTIGNKTPLIYSSTQNLGLSYYWKITLNETGKIPAFCNTFPELNHNEFTGFDVGNQFSGNKNHHLILIKDTDDYPKIKTRMEITTEMLAQKNITHSSFLLTGETMLEKKLKACTLAMWTAWHVAKNTNAEAEQVPMIESFKSKLRNQ